MGEEMGGGKKWEMGNRLNQPEMGLAACVPRHGAVVRVLVRVIVDHQLCGAQRRGDLCNGNGKWIG